MLYFMVANLSVVIVRCRDYRMLLASPSSVTL